MEEKTYRAGVETENGPAENLDSLWRQFGKAASEKEFCTAWLALQCSTIPGVASGVVLLGSAEEDRPYVLAASWPEGPGDFKHLAEVAERALKEKRGLALKLIVAYGAIQMLALVSNFSLRLWFDFESAPSTGKTLREDVLPETP